MSAATVFELLRNCAAELRRGEPIAPHTTVGVGGPARVMAFPRDDGDLTELLAAVHDAKPPLFLLGGGANLFADSRGVGGLAVNMTRWAEEFNLDANGLLVAGGGASLRDTAHEAARRGWGGIDFMAEVPGTIGGATVINAGTNVGGYVADRFQWVETLSLDGRKRRYGPEEMAFGYRTSRLLHGSEIVLRSAFRLERCETLGLSPETLRERFDAVMAERERKFPLDLPNFGSTFRSPGAPHPPAGKLLDDLGLKGFQVGGARVSDRHANFIVNVGGATSDDILAVMEEMHRAVLDAHGLSLRPEVHYLCDPGQPRPSFFPVTTLPSSAPDRKP